MAPVSLYDFYRGLVNRLHPRTMRQVHSKGINELRRVKRARGVTPGMGFPYKSDGGFNRSAPRIQRLTAP
jgi:hypothetical protein